MLMTGRRMNAQEALRWGIANRVVSATELMDSARELADQIANSAPLAVAALKEIYRATSELSIEEGYKLMRSGVLKILPTCFTFRRCTRRPASLCRKTLT